MSENTKFNLEYAIKQGYRVADDFAASRLMFEKKHYMNNTSWQVFVNWENGNYQEVNLNVTGGNQWVEMTNPGSAGIYYLLLRKGTPDQYRAHFGRHDGSTAPLVEWLGEALTDNHIISMATGTAVLITFLWDGVKYIAHIVPKEIIGRIPKHGYFYNWGAVNSGKLDIPGWRIPSESDFSQLRMALFLHNHQPGRQLKAVPPEWDNGLDSHGFKGLNTGWRDYDGVFDVGLGTTRYWTTTAETSVNAHAYSLIWTTDDFITMGRQKKCGLSIRLIRNSLQGYTAGEKVKDIDGNIYDTVQLFWVIDSIMYNQVWLKQNLATGRYNDGVGIPYITNAGSWANLNIDYGAMCAYGNNTQNIFE